eukprot:TRINITY_DN23193_c0_g1_i2.p1 TRINITY_DN23193_c0_g1~~TRINITY_DN23193_c0_g1_i2.p1  ORF type:complete len:313 (+),score=115.93 TRINITY_DN23193_c0_g1_i2:385-1323(+)
MASYDNPFEEVALGADQSPGPARSAPPVPAKNSPPPVPAHSKPMPPPPQPSSGRKDPYVTEVIADMNTPIDLTWEGIQRKERELDNREQALNRRDDVLQNREKTLPRQRIKNWPTCRPIIYHDIEADIEDKGTQAVVRRAYIGWFFECAIQLINMISLLANLIVGGKVVGGFVLSIGFLIWHVPISFVVYRMLYQAGRKGKATLYVLYFIFLWWTIIWCAYFFIGIAAYGGGGFFCMIDSFEKNVGAGIIGIICMVGWGLLIVFKIYIFIVARRLFQNVGGLDQAKADVKDSTVGKLALNKNVTGQAANQFV